MKKEIAKRALRSMLRNMAWLLWKLCVILGYLAAFLFGCLVATYIIKYSCDYPWEALGVLVCAVFGFWFFVEYDQAKIDSDY